MRMRRACGRSSSTAAGPQIGELMERLGKVPEFRDGLRVTDAETLDIARMVLVGKVNRDIVAAINVHGAARRRPVGRGRRPHRAPAPAHPELGFVGDVDAVNPAILERLLAEDLIPVVATIGVRRRRPGLQHQRRHRRRRDRRGPGRREARVPHRRRGLLADVDDPISLITTTTADELERPGRRRHRSPAG